MSGLPGDASRGRPGPAPLLRGGPVAGVLFDYGLTLVHFARPSDAIDAAQESIASLVAAAGHPRPSAAELRRAVHDRVDAEVAAHDAGEALEEVDVVALERRAFADIGLHLDADLLDRCSVLVQEAWWQGVHLYPDVLAPLRALRRGGLRVGLCSNAPYRPASMHAQLAHVGLDALLDAAVFSGEVGWRKPSRRLFEAALRALGTGADETVFVGDRLREDVGGAAAAGMRTVLVVRDGAAPQDAQRGRGPDAVIRSLEALPPLVFDHTPLRDVPGQKSERVYTRRAPPARETHTRRGIAQVDFRDYLKERCRLRGISLHRLALLCDLNQIYFYQAVNKNKENPPPWVLRRAAPHLGVSYVELMIAAGYLTDEDLLDWRNGAAMAATRVV